MKFDNDNPGFKEGLLLVAVLLVIIVAFPFIWIIGAIVLVIAGIKMIE